MNQTLKFILAVLLFSTQYMSTASSAAVVDNDVKNVPEKDAENVIRRYYGPLLSDSLWAKTDMDALNALCLSPRCMEQINAMSYVGKDGSVEMSGLFDSNIFTRSQDAGNALSTLDIKHLEGNWYMVSYISGKGTSGEELKNIPLRVTSHKGKCLIDYVTPEWDGLKYGDRYMTEEKVYGLDIQPETEPRYDGGDASEWLSSVLKDKVPGLKGDVVMSFKVGKNGRLDALEIKLTREQEYAIWKAWNEMQDKWQPGREQGKPVVTEVSVPVRIE